MAATLVTLFGKLLDSHDHQMVVLDVLPTIGDAPRFGLAGQVTIAKRQCVEVADASLEGDCDVVRIPEHIARMLAETRQPTPPPATNRKRP